MALFKMAEEHTTMTTRVLSLENETRTSFWVPTNYLHSGGGSEVLSIVLRFVDRTNNAPDRFFGSAGLGFGDKVSESTFNRSASATMVKSQPEAFVAWTFSSER